MVIRLHTLLEYKSVQMCQKKFGLIRDQAAATGNFVPGIRIKMCL